MTADEWLQRLANEVQHRLPDADVDDVNDGCLAICRGHAAIAISAAHGKVLAVASLDRGNEGPWAADRVAHEEPLLFNVSEDSIREATERIVGLLV